MPDVTLSTDIDAFLKTANDAAARTELGLGSAAEAATGDFATAAEGILAGTALQPADPTLESVTDNGATTLNDIQVGRIVTAGNTLGPVATAVDSIAIGGTGNSATGAQSEVLGGGGSSATGTGSTIVGGNASSNSGNWSIVAGGRNHNTAASRTGILGGEYANVTHADASMLSVRGTAIANKESQATQTAHVDNLHIFEGGFKMPTGATDTYVLTTDGNGVGTWQAAGTVLSGTTANATPTEIFVDGTPTNRVDVATGSTITFSALVAARSATESAGYKIEGVIKNDAGTAALVGVVAKTVFAEEDIAWDITVTAANNALTFIVTGDSVDSVSWEVTLNKIEAT